MPADSPSRKPDGVCAGRLTVWVCASVQWDTLAMEQRCAERARVQLVENIAERQASASPRVTPRHLQAAIAQGRGTS